ncbi:hypothetical protein, partial [Paracoccus sp. IB05]|uniref:hypothetical protein n=1 Tax=Paracoccus sp. IB05 TaxID=2779367 RepID=UPI001E37C3A8
LSGERGTPDITGFAQQSPHQLSKYLIEMIHRLEAAGLVRVSAYSYAGPGVKTNRNSRVQASHWMQEKFRGLKIEPGAIWEVPREPIILKSASREDEAEGPIEKAGKPIDYDDTDETRRMRGQL